MGDRSNVDVPFNQGQGEDEHQVGGYQDEACFEPGVIPDDAHEEYA